MITRAYAPVEHARSANILPLCVLDVSFARVGAFRQVARAPALFNDDSSGSRQGNCSLDDHQHRQHQKCRANRHFFSDSACRLHTTVTNYYQLAVTAAALLAGCFQTEEVLDICVVVKL